MSAGGVSHSAFNLCGGVSHSAFNLAENVPVRRISASVAPIRYTRAARQLSTGRWHSQGSRRTSPGDGSFGQLRQRERLSLSNHTQRERIPSPTTHEAHEDAAVALNKLSTAVKRFAAKLGSERQLKLRRGDVVGFMAPRIGELGSALLPTARHSRSATPIAVSRPSPSGARIGRALEL